MLGVIGGSGLEVLSKTNATNDVSTPYGIVQTQVFTINGVDSIFISRHGRDHTIPPHKINYKANIWALKSLSVTHVLSTAAVGSLRLDFNPGLFGIVSQFIDFTKNRESTFLDSFVNGIKHIDMTEPYSTKVNLILENLLIEEKIPYMKELTLVVTEGPRFETPAEIKAFSILGGDIVGMTGYPEVSLAKELEMEYSCLVICTNFAAGITKQKLSHEEVIENMRTSYENVRIIISKTCCQLRTKG